MKDCVFCKIIAGEIPSNIIDQDENLIVFVSMENYPLISPKKHLQDVFALDPDTASQIMQKSLLVAPALKKALSCDGILITQTNGEAAGQSVFHYHLHLQPKWEDGRVLGTSEADRAELAEKVRTNL